MLSDDLLRASSEEEPVMGRTYEDETVTNLDGCKIEFDSVGFVRCRFTDCDFTGASFCNAVFDKCDFSNCSFADSYWKNTDVKGCKGDGSRFTNSTFKWVKLCDSQFRYANFGSAFWEFCQITECSLRESFLSEVKFKKTTCVKTDFTSVDFFKTPLKGMDLSDCVIDNIMVSDQYTELAGLKVNLFQAAELAKLMGVKIV